jgi:intraflagellar transport protein 140
MHHQSTYGIHPLFSLFAAEFCLGSMEHVRGSWALRSSQQHAELDARIGCVAVQLGLVADAERLFANCQRWDLLGQLQAARGDWDAALDVATQHDRVRLKAMSHARARHLEALGDTAAALQHYRSCGAVSTDVLRVLWQTGRHAELEQLAASSSDPGVLLWWARLCESGGRLGQAVAAYQQAGVFC